MLSALQSGLSGARASARDVDLATRRVAGACRSLDGVSPGPEAAPPEDLAGGVVAMLVGQRGFELNLETVRTADEMLGALLDVKG